MSHRTGWRCGQCGKIWDTDPISRIYRIAAEGTGKSEEELAAMARSVFASMLFHAMEKTPAAIWSVITIEPGNINVEVNVPARCRAAEVLLRQSGRGIELSAVRQRRNA